MRPFQTRLLTGTFLLASCLLWSCGSSTEVEDKDDKGVVRGPEWSESSHGKVAPDTAAAFPAARRILTISMSDATWNSMVASLAEACGGGGSSSTCTGSSLDDYDSVSAWRVADLLADGRKWASVGIKLPSNGEVADAWKAGRNRFPFRITMDKWEKEIPAIDNQRFYGFQKLSLENLEDDSTGLRHQVAGALYRAQGVPALRSTLVALKLTHGSTTLDLGLYSLREMVDGPFLSRWFPDNDGNLYEPASTLAAFNRSDFEEGSHDGTFTDAIAFVGALNASNRTTAPDAWRNALGQTFDTDGFLSWLAVSTALGDGGSYGDDAENFALYANGGKLHWMALALDKTFKGSTRGIWHTGASTTWPLIANVLGDSVLCESYKSKVGALVRTDGPLDPARLEATIRSVAGTSLSGLDDAATRPAKLLAFASVRKSVVDTSLANHTCPSRD